MPSTEAQKLAKRRYRKLRAANVNTDASSLECQLRQAVKRMVSESGRTINDVAHDARISNTVLYDVLNEKQPCTVYAATLLSKALGYEWSVKLHRAH